MGGIKKKRLSGREWGMEDGFNGLTDKYRKNPWFSAFSVHSVPEETKVTPLKTIEPKNKNLARIAAPGWMCLPISYRRIPILWRSSALNCAQIKPTQATVTITRALRTANTIMGTSFQIYPN
jgi:hypothetical protein